MPQEDDSKSRFIQHVSCDMEQEELRSFLNEIHAVFQSIIGSKSVHYRFLQEEDSGNVECRLTVREAVSPDKAHYTPFIFIHEDGMVDVDSSFFYGSGGFMDFTFDTMMDVLWQDIPEEKYEKDWVLHLDELRANWDEFADTSDEWSLPGPTVF